MIFKISFTIIVFDKNSVKKNWINGIWLSFVYIAMVVIYLLYRKIVPRSFFAWPRDFWWWWLTWVFIRVGTLFFLVRWTVGGSSRVSTPVITLALTRDDFPLFFLPTLITLELLSSGVRFPVVFKNLSNTTKSPSLIAKRSSCWKDIFSYFVLYSFFCFSLCLLKLRNYNLYHWKSKQKIKYFLLHPNVINYSSKY